MPWSSHCLIHAIYAWQSFTVELVLFSKYYSTTVKYSQANTRQLNQIAMRLDKARDAARLAIGGQAQPIKTFTYS